MRLSQKYMNSLPYPVKALIVTVFALLFSHIAIYDLMDVSYFAPMQKASDFRFSDFYTLVASTRHEKVESGVVVVPVDGCNRREIAGALDDIDFCMPAAVGLDVAFSMPTDTLDDPLAEALASCSNLVMPVTIDDGGALRHVSYYDGCVNPSGGFASVNIQGGSQQRATVREFCPIFKTSEGNVPSMPFALASLVSPDNTAKLLKRNNHEEAINFTTFDIDTISPGQILDFADAIEGKVVLIGKINNAGDLHATPLDNFTPGIFIHAYTTATILSGDFTKRLSKFEIYFIAFVVCFLIAWLNMRIGNTPLGSFTIRIVQFLLLYLMILLGTWAYVLYNVDLNFAYVMMVTTLCVVACDIYNGIFDNNGILVYSEKGINYLGRFYKLIRDDFGDEF